MSKYLNSALIALFALVALPNRAYAVNTAASFDLSYGITSLSIVSLNSSGSQLLSRTMTSNSVFQIDYNVALFDYKTVATLSFTEVASSNYGSMPLTRIGLGASYHFIRVNGQRVVLDNQVEGKIWGVSPALELTFGLTVLSIKDTLNKNVDFTSSMIDMMPRLLVEIPVSSSFLLMLRAGYLKTLMGGGLYKVTYSGSMFSIGFKLTTL
ncbi:MAG: hypothetical protein JST80_07030 [Bdellovibrionales bacterium]|nr:hypothetical protein [Bdellovibrionales bacterium]